MTQEKATVIVPLLGPLPALLPSSRYTMLHNATQFSCPSKGHDVPKKHHRALNRMYTCIYKKSCLPSCHHGNYKLPQSSCETQSTELPHKSQVKSSQQNPLERSNAKRCFSTKSQTGAMAPKPKF